MDKVKQLTELKNHIESLEKHHQIEILKILSKNMCKINENKSGVFVNMTFLEEPILNKIQDYLNYMKEQEENLITTEYQKQEFINSYFIEKEDKDNLPITYSISK
jgi:hypothetical protein|tara:strand:+ start:319 stop:633 length:315 start_codon:yes stop_codon:yes gene_type:complete